jgi:hypothetical protein
VTHLGHHAARLAQAEALEEVVSREQGAGPAGIAGNFKRLFKYLEDASDDAKSFAQQAKQDAERHKVPSAEATSISDAGRANGAQQPAEEKPASDEQARRLHRTYQRVAGPRANRGTHACRR